MKPRICNPLLGFDVRKKIIFVIENNAKIINFNNRDEGTIVNLIIIQFNCVIASIYPISKVFWLKIR